MAKRGRPKGSGSKYDPKFCQDLINYFDIHAYFQRQVITTGKNDYQKVETVDIPNDMPFLIGFAKKIGVTYQTINTWGKEYPDFALALKIAEKLSERILIINGLKGLYASSFAICTAKNKFGWRDEQHIKQSIETLINFGSAKDIDLSNGNRLAEFLKETQP